MARNANWPVSEMKTTRESRSTPSNQILSGSKTMPPAKSTSSRSSASDLSTSGGSCTITWPTKTIWLASISTPTRAMTMLGVDQPSSSIGPMTKPPALNGKIVRSWLMICGALAIGSCGNRKLSSEPLARPADSVSTLTVCCTPSRPPMPVSVKPKPSWIGGSCAVMISSSDQPPGFLVASRPIALTPIAAILMSRMPPYSPWSGSKSRKPPPLTMPASIARPAPDGGFRSNFGAVTPASRSSSLSSVPRRSIEPENGPIETWNEPEISTAIWFRSPVFVTSKVRNGICTGLFGIFSSGIVAFRPVPSFRRRPPAVSAMRPKVSATVTSSPITAPRNGSSPTFSTSSLSSRSNSTFGVVLASVKPPASEPILKCVFDSSPRISGLVRLKRMPICDVPVSVGAVSGGSGT